MTEEVSLASLNLAVLERIDRDLHSVDPPVHKRKPNQPRTSRLKKEGEAKSRAASANALVKRHPPLLPLRQPPLLLITLLRLLPLLRLRMTLHQRGKGIRKGREDRGGGLFVVF